MRITEDGHKKDVINRLKRVEGQLRGVREMLETGNECVDIAAQLSACRSAISQALGTFVLCSVKETYAKGGKAPAVKEVEKIIKQIV